MCVFFLYLYYSSQALDLGPAGFEVGDYAQFRHHLGFYIRIRSSLDRCYLCSPLLEAAPEHINPKPETQQQQYIYKELLSVCSIFPISGPRVETSILVGFAGYITLSITT